MWCRSPRALKRLGKHRNLLYQLQLEEGRPTPAEAGNAPDSDAEAPEKAPAIRITVGLKNAPDSWRDYFYWNMELDET